MNRQVAPSILLSVAIVCFFAVALYQHDPPQSRGEQPRSRSADAIARSVSAPQRGAMGTTSARSNKVEERRPAPTRRESKPEQVVSDARPSIASSNRASVRFTSNAPVRQPESNKVTNNGPIEVGRQPGSPFTVVEADETLEDVALRVYGSSALSHFLWRANRDALVTESPLSTGMVLRTPVVR